MSPRMLERRGHSGDMALWMEQGRGAAVAVKQLSLWAAVLQLLILDGQSWGLFWSC